MTSSAHRHGAGILPILATIKLGQSWELLPLPNSCCRIYDSLEAPSKARVSRYYHHSFYSVFLKSIWYYMSYLKFLMGKVHAKGAKPLWLYSSRKGRKDKDGEF